VEDAVEEDAAGDTGAAAGPTGDRTPTGGRGAATVDLTVTIDSTIGRGRRGRIGAGTATCTTDARRRLGRTIVPRPGMITAVAEGGTTTTIEDTIEDTTIGTLPGTTMTGEDHTTEDTTGTTIGRGVTTAGTSARGADETAVATLI
jgi:hypothetical protein